MYKKGRKLKKKYQNMTESSQSLFDISDKMLNDNIYYNNDNAYPFYKPKSEPKFISNNI